MSIHTKIEMWDLDTGIEVKFQNVFIHPFFEPSPDYDDYDMAILELTPPILTFNHRIIPICVPWISEIKDPDQNNERNDKILSSFLREKLQWLKWSNCWLGNKS